MAAIVMRYCFSTSANCSAVPSSWPARSVSVSVTAGLSGMDLLQTAMQYHLGGFGTVFIAATLALFSFSTFLGVLYYARGNVAYLCGDNWWSQTVYKLIALVMLLIGGL